MEEIIMWLPDENYLTIQHFSFEDLTAAEREDLFSPANLELMSLGPYSFLPPAILKRVDSITYARLSGYEMHEIEEIPAGEEAVSKEDAEKQKRVQEVLEKSSSVIGFDGKSYGLIDTGTQMLVARVPDLRNIIKENLLANAIVDTGEIFSGRPVYSWRQRESAGESEIYGWAAVDELLASTDRKLLERMIAAGKSGYCPALNREEIVQLGELFPKLGPGWTWQSYRTMFDAQLQLVLRSEGESERYKAIQQDAARQRQYTITTSLGDSKGVTQRRTILIFADDDAAEREYKRRKQRIEAQAGMPDSASAQGNLQKTVASQTSIELDGKIIIEIVTINEEFREKQEELKKELQQKPKG